MKQLILDLSKPNNVINIDEDTEVVGLFIGKKNSSVQTNLQIVHKKPSLKSLTVVKAVLFDESRFDMLANLVIQTGAKLTDGYLRIDVLVMSEKAKARAIPSLEITEEDVKGGHGATVGEVDSEQLFYLMSRGLKKSSAERVLVEGFINEAVEMIQSEQVKQELFAKLNE